MSESITPRGEQPTISKSTTITSGTIRKAYIHNDRRAIRQIEAYGSLNRKILREMIHREKKS